MKAVLLVSEEFAKAHVKGYTRKDGTVVAPYTTKVTAKPKQKVVAPQLGLFGGKPAGTAPGSQKVKPNAGKGTLSLAPKGPPAPTAEEYADGWGSMFGDHGFGSLFGKPKPKPKAYHPRLNDDGKRVGLYEPSKSDLAGLASPGRVATIVPGDELPAELNGIPFTEWQAPDTVEGWNSVEGLADLEEPPMEVEAGKKPASGLVILEPDGRAWVISPSNQFGGYKNTFPKGKVDEGLTPQANAIKEAYEESGLKCSVIGLLGDVKRTTSVTRYYLATRDAGNPADVGWETQAVHLVPVHQLYDFLDKKVDHEVVDLLAGQ